MTDLAPSLVGRDVDIISNALSFVRSHFEMQASYLSEFVGDSIVFRAVNAPGWEEKISVGRSVAGNDSYCKHIRDGRLPELINDTRAIPFTEKVAVTHSFPIRSHVSVPVRRSDGSVYGMLCCLSPQPNLSLNSRDLDVMRVFGSLCAEQINFKCASEMEAPLKGPRSSN